MRRFFTLIFLSTALLSFFAVPAGRARAESTTSAAAVSTTNADAAESPDVVPLDTEKAGSDDRQGGTKSQTDGTYEHAIVTNVGLAEQPTPTGGEQKQLITIQYLSGPLKGKTRVLSTDIDSNPYSLRVAVGDKVVIYLQPDPAGGEAIGFLESFDRTNAIIWLIVLFVATLVLLAGWQGMKVAFSIFLSVALIGWILIPAFLKGINPVPVALIVTALLSTISSVLATGWSRKSLVTIVGTIGGTLVAYFISHIFSTWAHLGGLSSEEDRLFFEKNPLLNPQGLLFAGIIIASMGVVEDVAVSIASGVVEVFQANPRLTFKQLFRSGMVVGRDHMSALANTLIFAYVGASLSTLLLYSQYGGSWVKFLNFDSVVDEVVRSLSGTIGLVFTVPITALLATFVCINARHERTARHEPMDTTGHTHSRFPHTH